MDSKPIWKSKTFWVNAIALGAMVSAGMGFEISPELQGGLATGIMAVVNIGLRFVTKQPVKVQ